MKKKVLMLFVIFMGFFILLDVKAEEVCKVTKGKGTDIGDEITCGTESFYVLSSNATNIEMLAKYNLEVGSNHSFDVKGVVSSKEIENPTKIQNSKCIEYYDESNNRLINCAVAADTFPYEKQKIYYDDYKKYLIDTLKLSSDIIVDAMTVKKLTSLGCDTNNMVEIKEGYYEHDSTGSCLSIGKPWLYQNSYFLNGAAVYFNSIDYQEVGQFLLSNDGNITQTTAPFYGIRPIVTIPKSDIESFDEKEPTKDTTTTNNANKNGNQTVEVGDTLKSAYIGYCIGAVILVLGVMVLVQTYRKTKNN